MTIAHNALPAAATTTIPPRGVVFPAWVAYLLALALGGGAASLGILAFAAVAPVALLVCVAAVAVAAWLGGFGPGILAALPGAVVGGMSIGVAPALLVPGVIAQLGAYLLAAVLIAALGEGRRRATRARAAALTETAATAAGLAAATAERDEAYAAYNTATGREVAAQGRADAAIAATERRFRALMAHGADAFLLLDAGGAVRFASPAAADLLGTDAERLRGAALLALAHPEDADRVRTLLTETARTPGGAASAVFCVRHPDGGWRWAEGAGVNLRDDPDVRATLVRLRDLTAQVRAEVRVSFLGEAGEHLLSATGDADALVAAAGCAVPRFAAGCAVELVGEGGTPRRAFTALPDDLPPDAHDPFAAAGVSAHVVRALVTGQATRFAPAPAAPDAMLVAPLRARGATLGAVTFAAGDTGPFTVADLVAAGEFAGWLALALDNARAR